MQKKHAILNVTVTVKKAKQTRKTNTLKVSLHTSSKVCIHLNADVLTLLLYKYQFFKMLGLIQKVLFPVLVAIAKI